jgi:hypothetical protein
MILDTLLQFSAAQAVTALADTASTNVVDAGLGDAGAGDDLYLFITTTEAVTSAGAATVQFVLQTDTAVGFGTAVDAMLSAAIPKATLVAGATVKMRLPVGLSRYLRVAYRVGTAVLTAGKFSAYIAMDVPVQASYASGFTVA